MVECGYIARGAWLSVGGPRLSARGALLSAEECSYLPRKCNKNKLGLSCAKLMLSLTS